MIDFLRTDKLYWLTEPRYAVISVPSGLAGWAGLIGQKPVALVLVSVVLLGVTRLVWLKLLPHEQARLDQAGAALYAAQPNRAVTILQKPLRFSGAHYRVKRATVLARAYCQQGELNKAHEALSAFDQQHLRTDERLSLQIAWALLYLDAGNPVEARRRLDKVPEQECEASLECLLVKAELQLQSEHYPQARALLETGLDRCKDSAERVLLHNNLARIEGLQGRKDTQLRHLRAARTEFNNAARADLTDIVHHNLAIALVRDGQTEEAKAVLREAFAAGDPSDLPHVLSVLNNQLHTAREASDSGWVRDIYAEFDRQLKRLNPRTPREQLALDISKLRMVRNDAVPRSTEGYPALLQRLLDSLAGTSPAIPVSDRVAGLVEVRHDLKQEIRTAQQQNGTEAEQLFSLLQRATKQLLEHSTAIDTYLTSLSPKMIAPLTQWHRYRTDIDKARVEQADTPEALKTAFTRLFDHLREKAEWLTEQGTAQQAIEAWLIMCDEVLAYHDQLAPTAQPSWRQAYGALALHALEQATKQMEDQKHHRQQVDQLIGLAYFSLRLRADKLAAARWINIAHSYKPALEHYAAWLRDYYTYVCRELAAHGGTAATVE